MSMFQGLVDILKNIKIRHDLIYLFLFALFLRSIYFILVLTQLGVSGLLEATPDCVNYVHIAQGFPSILFQPDRMLYTFGPGYGLFLAPFFLIFGISGVPVIIFQIILSSLSCLMIYKLARMLRCTYIVSMTAGILAAISYTAISLSSLLLSGNVYFFFFLLSLILFLRAMEKDSARDYVLSGLIMGYCILTRSIGQFWIVAMIIIAAGTYLHRKKIDKQMSLTFWRYLKRPLISIILTSGIVLIWVIRNWIVVGVPITSAAAIVGTAKLTSLTIERLEDRPWGEIIGDWHKDFEETHGYPTQTLADSYQAYKTGILNIIAEHPGEVFKTYMKFTWANIHDLNYLPRNHFPDYKRYAVFIEYKILKRFYIDSLILILSLAGCIILLIRRQYYIATILSLIFIYYGLLGGFAPWQGSRLFYPGQIGWSILCSVSMVAILRFVSKRCKLLLGKG